MAPQAAADNPAPGTDTAATRLTLRAKGLIAFGALALYLLLIAGVVESQRMRLADIVADLERVHGDEEVLHRASFSLAHAILAANEHYYRDPAVKDFVAVLVAAETVQTGLEGLARRNPELAPLGAEVGERTAALAALGGRDRLLDLRESLHRVAAAMDPVTSEVRSRKKALAVGYRSQYDAISVTWIGMGVIGMLIFGATLALFFTRLTGDLGRLQRRALDVVNGYRGPALGVTRSDEIGTLMRTVNRMQKELREHEAQMELARRQQFHREKMAAVGGLAAQIAHEINNPIAAIAGVAQAIAETRQSQCRNRGGACQPELILEQATRIAGITRQIADFSAPQAAEPQLLDLNALVESTCAFVRYDKRFRALALELELDRQLPAVTAVGDHLTQVLMNLLINAADAIAEAGVRGRVTLATRRQGDSVVFTVADNGKGMEEAVRRRAFEEFFTTKPQGSGSGLGLSLSRRFLRQAGGDIEIESQPGVGTLVAVRLPLAPALACTS